MGPLRKGILRERSSVKIRVRENEKITVNSADLYKAYQGRKVVFIILLFPILFLLIGIVLVIGSADITIWDAYASILRKIFPERIAENWLADVSVWNLRLPRILMGIVTGAILGATGAVMQGVLRNPLASPYTLGISSGASFGASLAILANIGIFGGQIFIVGNAFLFSMISTLLIVGLAVYRGASPRTMLLTGIALNYVFSAGTTLLQYFGEAEAVKEAVFWTVGNLGKANWPKLGIAVLVAVICLPVLLAKSRALNAMGGGDEDATALGVRVNATRIILMSVSAFLVAAVVSFTGTIGFIGLVAPHICRMIIGNDNRFLLPCSALVGGILLLVADTVSRVILAPTILPIGVLTSFLGAPLFLYLIFTNREDYR